VSLASEIHADEKADQGAHEDCLHAALSGLPAADDAVRGSAREGANEPRVVDDDPLEFSNKLNSYLTGKTPAEIAAQRDSLIAEARKHFANDPKTRDAVINLLSSETAKRSTMLRH
jgi:hypothetical protein